MKFLKLPQLYHNGGIHSIDVNQDNTILVSGGTDNKIGVWNLKKLIELSKLVLTHNSPEVRLKLKSLEPKQYITCHKSLINVVRFFKGDNKRFISSDVNGNVSFILYMNNLKQSNYSLQKYRNIRSKSCSGLDNFCR